MFGKSLLVFGWGARLADARSPLCTTHRRAGLPAEARRQRTSLYALALVIFAMGLMPSLADAAWYDTNWQLRKSIVIDRTQVVGTQTDFPVLISITDAQLAAAARADGFDIVFTDDDETTKLDHEIERYVNGTGELVAWVKIPSISAAADKTIYMYYRYPAAADQQNATGVWSNGYEAVYHLNDDFLDSTINVRNATNNGSSDIVSQVADGQDFTPIDDLRLGSWSVSGSALTMQAWARFDDFDQDDPRVVSKGTADQEQDHVFMLSLSGAGMNHLRMRVKTGTSDISGSTTLVATSNPLTVNTWYHVGGTYDGAQMRLFSNGTQIAITPKTGSLRLNGWEIWAGNNPNNTTDTGWASLDGRLDELRISSISRTSAWLTTEYNNQSNPPTFYTLGMQAPRPTMIFYVRTDGNDSNPGTANSSAGAWRNIQKAADTMAAGDKTFVVAGTYNELVVPLNGGTAIDQIVYEALGSVILNGGNARCYGFRVENNSGYTTIDGFIFTNYLDCGSGHANAYFDNSPNCQVLNNVFHDTGRDAIGFYGTTANCLVHNNLIYNMDDDGITPYGGGNHTIRNTTIFNTADWALEAADTAGNIYENNIFWDDIDNTGVATYSYNDYINSVLPGVGNISADPLFIGATNFRLSQIVSGQGSDSPAIDAGGVTAASLGLDTRTTRTDSGVDVGTVNQGFHYANGISGPVLDIVKRAFQPDGTPIPTGATIPNGVEFKYLLYINNSGIGRSDVSVRDVLDAAFQYQTGTVQVDNSVAECAAVACTPAEELAIFAAVDGAAFLSDVVDGDVGSYTGASLSIDAGNGNLANAQLNIISDAVWAILFSVKMP